MGYYSTKVRPLIAAADQHSAFANRDVLFDWTAIQIPRKMGSVKLVSCNAFIRPKGDAGATANNFAFKLWFADDDRTTFGTVDSPQDDRPNRDLLGCLEFSAENEIAMGTNSSITSMISGPTLDADHGKFDLPIFTPKDDLDAHTAGYHTIYVAGLSGSAFDWTTINRVNEGDADAGAQSIITMDGSSMDVREHYAVGDTLHGYDESSATRVLGEVASVDSATQFTLTAGTTDALKEDDFVYNIHPIELVFGFEY